MPRHRSDRQSPLHGGAPVMAIHAVRHVPNRAGTSRHDKPKALPPGDRLAHFRWSRHCPPRERDAVPGDVGTLSSSSSAYWNDTAAATDVRRSRVSGPTEPRTPRAPWHAGAVDAVRGGAVEVTPMWWTRSGQPQPEVARVPCGRTPLGCSVHDVARPTRTTQLTVRCLAPSATVRSVSQRPLHRACQRNATPGQRGHS